MTTVQSAAANAQDKSADRIYNFSAGPGCLPEAVVKQAQEDIWSIFGTGIGIMEHSHRGKAFDRVLEEAVADCRAIANIPDDYHILFMTGGATAQSWQVPANLLPKGRTADYFNTGVWAQKSIEDAAFFGDIHECASSKPDNYTYIPTGDQVNYSDNPAYVHFTSNNTIMGIEHHTEPHRPANNAPLVCDMSSDIYSRPLDVTKYGLIYAGAQKNLGTAGTTLVIVHDDLVKSANTDLPKFHKYATFVKGESRPNTPPTFPIYVVGRVFKWIKDFGSLAQMEAHNKAKAKIIYDVLDASSFYKPHARTDSRSLMNITFTTPNEDLDEKFIEEAGKQGMDGLKGHRSVGGMRASIYNAFPVSGCHALAQFMQEFERTHG